MIKSAFWGLLGPSGLPGPSGARFSLRWRRKAWLRLLPSLGFYLVSLFPNLFDGERINGWFTQHDHFVQYLQFHRCHFFLVSVSLFLSSPSFQLQLGELCLWGTHFVEVFR